MRPLLSWRNWLDDRGTALAVDNETDGLGGNNMLTPQPSGEVWRSTYAGATRNIRIDFGAAREIGAIALILPRDGVQPLQSDRVRIRLGSTGVDSADTLDTGAAGMSFDTGAISTWCYPLAAGIRPNLITNPSLRDNSVNWSAAGSTPPAIFGPAVTTNALRDVGGGYATRASMASGDYMDAFHPPFFAAPGRMQARARLAATGVNASLIMLFYDASSAFLGAASSNLVAPRAGQWKAQPSEWSDAFVDAVAPAGTTQAALLVRGAATGAVTNPMLHWAETAAHVGDPTAGARPIFSGNYVGLAGNIQSLESVAFARYVTISITSSQAYLDIGRLWIGPALVANIGATGEARDLVDAGDALRAPLSGNRFYARGPATRSMRFDLGVLTEAEANRSALAAMFAGRSGQVLAIRDVLRAQSTTMLGSMTQPPAPVRLGNTDRLWQATVAVEEDL